MSPIIQIGQKTFEPMTNHQILEAAEQLPNDELELLAGQIAQLAAKRRCPSLPSREAELLRRINEEPDPSRVQRYHDLTPQRKSSQLDADQTSELLGLSDWLEEFHAERLGAVAELARLRGLALAEMMDNLGVKHLVSKV